MHRNKNTSSEMISTNFESHLTTLNKKSFSTSSNKNHIFWPFHHSKYILKKAFQLNWTKTNFLTLCDTEQWYTMLWLIPNTSTLAKRKVSWWAKKRWILQSQFRRSRGKSYLFDNILSEEQRAKYNFLILWDIILKESNFQYFEDRI